MKGGRMMLHCKQCEESSNKHITLTLTIKQTSVITACITIYWYFEAILKAFVTLFGG